MQRSDMVDGEMKTQDVLAHFGNALTYRQLDSWTTACYLSDDPKKIGQGVPRKYTDAEVIVLTRMLALVGAGVKPDVASVIAKGDVGAYNTLAQALEDCADG